MTTMEDQKHLEVVERIAKLEERVRSLECLVKKLDIRLWAVISGIILSILLQMLR